MTERIVEECLKRGTCPLNRKEFNETFAGADLNIQVRAAIDFAQQKDLAFARAFGDQAFLFSRLPKSSELCRRRQLNARPQRDERAWRSNSSRRNENSVRRPVGRAF
jgi:hypothetical protein